MKPLFLVGYMGCGKSTMARKAAKRLGLDSLDTDSAIEQREGASVVDIFAYQGEEYFRAAERAALDDIVTKSERVVISTGGGLPTWRDNMELINSVGVSVYLHREVENISSRLSEYGRRKRPRLKGLSDDELVDFMTKDLASREPYYLKATHTIECTALSDGEILDAIVGYMNL